MAVRDDLSQRGLDIGGAGKGRLFKHFGDHGGGFRAGHMQDFIVEMVEQAALQFEGLGRQLQAALDAGVSARKLCIAAASLVPRILATVSASRSTRAIRDKALR